MCAKFQRLTERSALSPDVKNVQDDEIPEPARRHRIAFSDIVQFGLPALVVDAPCYPVVGGETLQIRRECTR